MKNPAPAARARSRLRTPALAGLGAAVVLTAWAGSRHAVLARLARQPLSSGQRLTPHVILACGFAGTFVIVTAVVFVASAVTASRRARRTRQAEAIVPAVRRRRTAARGQRDGC
jgi:hypothetical protein